MKGRSLFIAAILCLMPIVPNGLKAQEYTQTPVTVSKEKVKSSDGKVYYSHVVQERQTLFSISRAYGVTVDDIYAANPEVKKNGLKKNDIILIPVVSDSGKNTASASTPQSSSSQTASSPSRNQQTASNQQEDSEEYFIHVVKWYEDINDIAAKYGIPAEYIIRYNGLKSNKVKSRTKLKIPRERRIIETTPVAEENPVVEENPSQEVSSDEGPVIETISEEQMEEQDGGGLFGGLFTRRTSVNAALIMPLGASGKPSANNFDFYSGVLMALRDLGNEGITTDLSVYDMVGGNIPVGADKMSDFDMVIGPVAPDDLKKALALSTKKTAVISPLDQRAVSLTGSNANFIQAPAPYDAQYEDIVKWIRSDRRSGDKVIVISEKGRVTEASTAIDSLVKRSGMDYTPFEYSIIEGRNILGSMRNVMTTEGTNRVLVNSEREAFVFDVVRNLNLILHNRIDVVLYSPARIRSFDTIDIEHLHNVNLHVSTSYFIDYEDARVRKFLSEYRALFGAEPTQFSFQGYDVAYFFTKGCLNGGGQWVDKLTGRNGERMLQSDFMLTKEGLFGGYVNEGIRRVIYDTDFKQKLIK
ncbi:MAG: LysM peptidoglycan-binding domain-containing protein [Bacteroidales bacterium]|nr:LysM peptidoglycan-binding domain-containing protein [Bacteroidales bacterium]MBQ9712491.1 LysM peptidoglycan-binding domain-containing protein [Bacteroidales bacterium]